ncbi:Ig-like domain repeat protein [Methanothermobacter sp. K4]|uniref:pseudomurein-binding repeat-containing protein n=1 Tax=Methanothermobacter sp. K4 TaxID=2913262 RepID=UPI001EDC3EA6|nr:Ig-like domain repeat protein [Methanothermobacter sp. K4]MCG2829208.1 Ig-like domain repeat protein [Methanothermobacter sp. K4]
MIKIITCFFLFLMGIMLIPGCVSAADIYVNATGGSDDNDGLSWAAAKATIGNATGSAASGDSIWVADGEYKGERNRDILIDRNLTITGQSTTGTVIDCEALGRAFNVSSGVVLVLRNLTLRNGSAPEGGAVMNHGELQVENCLLMCSNATGGGAIYSDGTVKLTGSYLIENRAEDGGALYSRGVLEVTESTFNGNEASGCGGSIYSASYSSLNIRDSSFALGHAEDGGGIYTGGDTLICNSTIAMNIAESQGGGLYVWAADGTEITVTVTDSMILYNTARHGGGISGFRNTDDSFLNLQVSDSLFRSNLADYGAGIHADNVNTTVSGCTFTENVASEHGGAIRNNYGNLTVRNTTFTDNRAGSAGGGISSFLAVLADITESTFTGNLAESWNTGSAVLSYFTVTVIKFCRILDNPGADVFCEDGPGVDARFNWWGCNAPDFSELTSGDVAVAPWMVLTLTTDPAAVAAGGTSLIKADLRHDSAGGYHDTFFVPYTGNVDFSSTAGSIDDAVMSLGTANSTLTGLTAPGTVTVNATLDAESASVDVDVLKVPSSITMDDSEAVEGDAFNLRARLMAQNPIPGKAIRFQINGVNMGTSTTDSDGWASLNLPGIFPPGLYNVTAEFQGDELLNNSSSRAELRILRKAAFELSNLTAGPLSGTAPLRISVSARVRNTGEAPGDYRAELLVNSVPAASMVISLAAGESGDVRFNYTITRDGVYMVTIGGLPARTVTVKSQGLTVKQIAAAALTVRDHYARYRKLPASVTIASKGYSMAQFLDLLARATVQLNSGNQNPLTPRSVGYLGSTGTWGSGKLSRSAYVSVAVSIRNFINSQGRAPRYASTSYGRVSFVRLVYVYSRVLAFYGANGRLPVDIAI